jgi:hypothetical protein
VLRSLLSAIGWLAAILAGSAVLCLAAIAVRPSLTPPWTRGPVVDVGTAATSPPRATETTTVTPPPVDRYPSNRITYDPGAGGRLYAGGSVSDDGGRTWRALTCNGRSVRLLGGPRALPPVPGPNGRLLVGGVLFDEPGLSVGGGPIARAAEWREGCWTPLVSPLANNLLIDSWRDLRARAIAYVPSGTAVVASAREITTFDGRSWATPGRLRSALVTASGALYAAVDEPDRFGLYTAESLGAPWMPLPDVRGIDALAELAGGAILALCGSRVGRLEKDGWSWTDLPSSVRPKALAAHPTRPLVAAAAGRRLLISTDGGRRFQACPLDFSVEWVAWDPFEAETLTLVGGDGSARRIGARSLMAQVQP